MSFPSGGAGTAAKGTVFTPPELARRLVEGLEGPVLDPACGDGALLAAARERRRGALHGIELQPALAERARARLGDGAQVLCADALDPRTPWVPGTWIAANPPWVSFSGREGASAERHAGARFRRRWDPDGGWPTLQGAFLARIAAHVAEEGTGARVLVPASLLEQEGYGRLRAAVSERCRVGAPERLDEDAFEGVIGPAALVTLAPGPGEGAEAPWGEPDPPALLEALARHPRLPAGTFADPGVHTGNAARELVVREGAPERPGVREGRCLLPYRLGPPRARLRTDLERTLERRFRLRPLEHYTAFPVLVRQTADRPIAARHTAPTYFRNSLLAAREVPGLDPAFVVAVLNGPVASAFHRARFADARQKSFPQVKVGHLAVQPFPIVHRDQDPGLHDELAARARALESRWDESDERALAHLTRRAFRLPRSLELGAG